MTHKKPLCALLSVALAMTQNTHAAPSDANAQSEVTVVAQRYAKVPLVLGIITAGLSAEQLTETEQLCSTIKKDLTFEQQFEVELVRFAKNPSAKHIKKLSSQGTLLLITITPGNAPETIAYALHDTQDAHLVCTHECKKKGTLVRGWAHNIADELWHALTSSNGIFSTRIAYCKSVVAGKKNTKHICIADYDGTHEQVLIKKPAVHVGPRWGLDTQKPRLFYSEYTPHNLRLLVADCKGHKKVISNFDGLNMLPSFAAQNKAFVYCASRGTGCCQIYLYQDGELQNITNNDGNNISPTLSTSGAKCYFCSDMRAGFPELYVYTFASKALERIANTEHCATPSYHEQSHQVVYARKVENSMQLFKYDEQTKQHTQLTFDTGNKQECSWSPCGRYLLYAVSNNGHSVLAQYNCVTGNIKTLTARSNVCTYPAWSPVYEEFPVVG